MFLPFIYGIVQLSNNNVYTFAHKELFCLIYNIRVMSKWDDHKDNAGGDGCGTIGR